MKKILLTALVTTGLIGTTVAVAGGHGKFQRGFGECNNNGYMRSDDYRGMRGGMRGNHGMHGGQHGRFGGFDNAKAYRWLDLTDEQQKQMQNIFDSVDKKDFFKKQRELSNKSREMIQSKTFDKTAFEKLLAEQDQLREENRLKQAELRNKAWNVLTDEQQKKVKARFNDRQDMMQKSMEYRQKWGKQSLSDSQ